MLILTAGRLIEPRRLAYSARASRRDAAVLLITIGSALAFGLDIAILAGVALSMLLYVSHSSRLKFVELVVTGDGVVRERRPADARDGPFIFFDLEGELFFGAAPHLGRCLDTIMNRIEEEARRHVVLRLKRVRNPDAVCLEQLEHFLKACSRRNVTVLLAGLQPDLLAAAQRLGFFTWYPQERAYVQGKDEDSATLAAIRAVYRELDAAKHGARPGRGDAEPEPARPLYYLL